MIFGIRIIISGLLGIIGGGCVIYWSQEEFVKSTDSTLLWQGIAIVILGILAMIYGAKLVLYMGNSQK